MRLFLIAIFAFILALDVCAQRKCSVDYQEHQHKQLAHPENSEQFESWLKDKISKKKNQPFSTKAENDIYTIPVVVHVIHRGEGIGFASNVADEQVHSQIEILNEDFRRLNEDASDTPEEFTSVAADIQIQFVLAKRDPEGLPTSGILREKGSLQSYSFGTDKALKSESYWPAEDYLNLWVAPLNDDIFGYAQFPVSDLRGFEDDLRISRLTDGIVINYQYFGEGFNAIPFSKGRTGTHEIGHFLGLNHIWGQGGCTSDDYCDDTPIKETWTTSCPLAGSEVSCESVDMFQNYMDFTDDKCMNLFTICQRERMRSVLENSPRRKSLLSSKALEEPIVTLNDLGIRQIISPLSGDCNGNLTPTIEVRNYGTNTITEFSIDLYVDDNLQESIVFDEIISELSTSSVSFSNLGIGSGTSAHFRFEITQTNGTADGNEENNSAETQIVIPLERTIPYHQSFDFTFSDWQVSNSAGNLVSWRQAQAPYDVLGNNGMKLAYSESSADSYGELDFLISPVFNLSGLPSADISLKYAYSGLPDKLLDALTIAVSTDCGNTFPEENYIYQRMNLLLSTTESSREDFTPEWSGEWEELAINITEFVGYENVVIAIIGHNGLGNNLYVDDFVITSENTLDYDLAIVSEENIPAVSCSSDIFPAITIKNKGTQTIDSFELSYTVDGSTQNIQLTELNLLPGKSHISRPVIQNLEDGEHNIIFSVSKPNGLQDQNSDNDSIVKKFVTDANEDSIPIKEDFETSDIDESWSLARTDEAHNWMYVSAPSETQENMALMVDGFNNTELGVENWFVSPVLDFSQSGGEASVSFKLSYANKNTLGANDRLRVLLSVNCGRSYDHTVYNKSGAELAVTQRDSEWVPSGENDWKTEIIDLSEHATWNQVRLAFVVTNLNGNKMYIDDIEFFNSKEPNLLDINSEGLRVYPNPAKSDISFKFDLNKKANINLRIVDVMGKVVYSGFFPSTLNQTYSLDNVQVDNGLYLVHAYGDGVEISRRVLIWN
ncbi:MAG: choice-of-anchor J domain-containing protein [Cyclobacteriaceae bacterium]